MVEHTITAAERGQRLDKYIRRTLPNAGSSFIYKMLRKKNITRNHGKADGSEILDEGDVIAFYFSDETYAKFAGTGDAAVVTNQDGSPGTSATVQPAAGRENYVTAYRTLSRKYPDIKVLYEQSELLFVEKPAGVLSQKSKDSDISLNEWFLGYLLTQGLLPTDGPWPYTPSVCNRLDRNTGGIVICAKTLLGSRVASRILRDRSVKKYYHLVVVGALRGSGTIRCWTLKDPRTNTVKVYDHETPGASTTLTEYTALRYSKANDLSLIEAELVTGKTHQLRVHLAHLGHPILGDPKYGDRRRNHAAASKGVRSQLLWSTRLELPEFEEAELADLSNKVIVSEPPSIFDNVMH